LGDFFDEINDFILSIFGLDKKDSASGKGSSDKRSSRKTYADPDMQAAWDELEDYLKGEPARDQQSNQKAKPSDYATFQREKERERLRQDYANLEVPYGSSFAQVKKAFKTQLLKYHPDKHTDNPEKARIATEITQKINASFQKIKSFEEKHAEEKNKKM
jgi:hypothetical protein